MPARRRRQVSDFPAEYLGIWELAVAGKLVLTFPSRAQATNQRQQLYTFRKRLSEESPAIAEPFFQADLLVEEGPNGTGVLSAYIPEWKKQARELLEQMKFAPTDPVATLESVQAQAEEEAKPAMDQTLKNLGFKAGE